MFQAESTVLEAGAVLPSAFPSHIKRVHAVAKHGDCKLLHKQHPARELVHLTCCGMLSAGRRPSIANQHVQKSLDLRRALLKRSIPARVSRGP